MIKKILFSAFLLLTTANIFSEPIIGTDVLQKINNAVFEVIVEKPKEREITYEQPLSFDHLPFSERNNPYISVGTAFLVDSVFYSAAHVFSIDEVSVYNKFFIRDIAGNIYKVQDIYKYDNQKDFICFTVKDFPKEKIIGLESATNVLLNTHVFSVGNALGEGVIIRNGLLTSETYEDRNGAWKWLRFSAAASPGNSGGPLINQKGEVLGIITMKSQNENLNYALPFREIDSVLTCKMTYDFKYHMPNLINTPFNFDFNYTVDLPLPIENLMEITQAHMSSYTHIMVDKVKKEYPFNPEDTYLQNDFFKYNNLTVDFPVIFSRLENRQWVALTPSNKTTTTTVNDIEVTYGNVLGLTMATIEKPQDIDFLELIKNPSLYMDIYLDAVPMQRTIGSKTNRILSYGKPSYTGYYDDNFERRWFIATWKFPFADHETIAYMLPLPGKLLIMLDSANTANIEAVFEDCKFMTDYILPDYVAKLSDWKHFLSVLDIYFPCYPLFDSTNLFNYDGNFYFNTKDYMVDIPADYNYWTDDNFLRLHLNFVTEDKKTIINNGGFIIANNFTNENYRYLGFSQLRKKPSDVTDKDPENFWNLAVNQEGFFNGNPYLNDQYLYCQKVYHGSIEDIQNNPDIDTLFYLSVELKSNDTVEKTIDFINVADKSIY